MKTKYVLIFSLIFSCLVQNMEAQTIEKTWQWIKKQGGNKADQNGGIDDQVIDIIPAVENDGSFIVVAKLTKQGQDTIQYYMGNSFTMQGDQAIIIAKHSCNNDSIIIRRIDDDKDSQQDSEFFDHIVENNGSYYVFFDIPSYSMPFWNDERHFIDTVISEPIGGPLMMKLDKNLNRKLFKFRPNNAELGVFTFGIGHITVSPENNFYMLISSGLDSAVFFDDTTSLYKGLSLVKMDTFGNILDVHQLADRLINNGHFYYPSSIAITDSSIYFCGGNSSNIIVNGISLAATSTGRGNVFKLDKQYNNIWYQETMPIGIAGQSDITGINVYNEDSLIITMSGKPHHSSTNLCGVTFQGDTLFSAYNTMKIEFPVILDPHTGQKLNWDYPEGEVYGYGIQDKIIENNKLFLNYSFYSINWKSIQINRIMGELYNGIFEYDITTGAIDTVTTYRFQDLGRPDRCATTSMAKIGDNFIVGGHYFTRMYFDSITLLQAGGPNTDMFLAKFGTGECVPCIPSQALFAYGVDTFALQAYSQAQQADSSYWQINGQYITTADSLNYSFADTGTYQICQIVQNHCSADTFCQNISIVCPAPQALFGITQNGQQISLQNNSMNSHQYQINWGDGQSNTDTTHLYSQKGNYTICMYVQNTCGTDTNCIDVEIATHIQQIAQTVFYWQVYPNPTQGDLHIVWQNIVAKEKTIRIQNIVGKNIAEQKIKGNNGKIKINTNEWTKGIYFINIESEGQNIARKKILVF